MLSKLAKYILPIPASSATSERIFSAGGLTVSHLRCQLDDGKVEDRGHPQDSTQHPEIGKGRDKPWHSQGSLVR